MNEEVFEEFMKLRFPRERDQAYIEEWRDRFRGGFPQMYMDSESLAAYKEAKRRHGVDKGTAFTGKF